MLKQISKRNITARRVHLTNDLRTQSMKQMIDVHGELLGATGVVKLNREHRSNILTPNFIK